MSDQIKIGDKVSLTSYGVNLIGLVRSFKSDGSAVVWTNSKDPTFQVIRTSINNLKLIN